MQDGQKNIQQQLKVIRKMVVTIAGVSLLILAVLLVFFPVDERILASGVVRAERDTVLYAPAEGVVAEAPVREGESVKKGDLVYVLDSTLLREELKNIEAAIQRAKTELAFQKARLERTGKLPLPREFWHMQEDLSSSREKTLQARVELDRARELFAKGLSSKQEVEHARLALSLAESEEKKSEEKLRILEAGLEDSILTEALAEFQRSAAALHVLEVQKENSLAAIERCEVRAPEEGIITTVHKWRPGEKVELGEEVVRISHGGAVRVDLFAGENQYYRLRPGQKVLMRSNTFDTMRHGYVEGEVVRVAVEPERNPGDDEEISGATGAAGPIGTTSPARLPKYRVVTKVHTSPQDLVLGSTVEARIILQRVPLWQLLLPEQLRPMP